MIKNIISLVHLMHNTFDEQAILKSPMSPLPKRADLGNTKKYVSFSHRH